MKRSVSFLALVLFFTVGAFGQKIKTPVDKSKSAGAPVKKKEPIFMPLSIINDDGSASSYNINRGDKLVYHVSFGEKEYDFIVTINDAGYEKGVDFNFEMTAPVNKKGHVTISGKARAESSRYINYFSGGELNLTDACTVWLTNKNFSEMPEKKTIMTLDDGSPEVFYRPEKDDVNLVVNVKGKKMKIDGFSINNAADGTGNETLWINNISSNSLILRMDLGWTIELKEIR